MSPNGWTKVSQWLDLCVCVCVCAQMMWKINSSIHREDHVGSTQSHLQIFHDLIISKYITPKKQILNILKLHRENRIELQCLP